MAAPPVPNWQAQILHGIGAPVTPANVTFLNAWARAEGGNASNNPFNTTQPAGGASSYNTVGVRNYTSPAQGIQATIDTLRNGRYGNILSALHQGSSPVAAAQALANSPWGTGALVLKILGAGGQVTAPPPGAAASTAPTQVRRPTQDGTALALLNEGAKLFGLPPLPAVPSSAPSRLPKAGPVVPSSPAPAQPTPLNVKGPTLGYIEHQAAPFGLTVTSTTGGKHAPGSYHYQGRAADFGGPTAKMAALAKFALSHAGQWTEFIYTGPGNPGYSILNGRVIPNSQLDRGLYAEHTNHVHLAR